MRSLRWESLCSCLRVLLYGRPLVLDVDSISGDIVNNNSVGWHDKLYMLAQSAEPPLVLLDPRGLGCRAGEDLYIAAL
jgi:hypothetical protein